MASFNLATVTGEGEARCRAPVGTGFCGYPWSPARSRWSRRRPRPNASGSTSSAPQPAIGWRSSSSNSKTGETLDRDQIVKGYEYERGRYATITDDELKDIQIESSKIIDLDRFVDRDTVDPLYLDTPYYVYPDGELAAETFRVIGQAMAHKNKVGLGRVTISSRERLVLVEPREAGLLMSTLRSADEVRPAEFGAKAKGEADPDMVAIAETIIERRAGAFEPAEFRDRYQDALRELVMAKTQGLASAPRAIEEPPKVINLMEALKRSLAQDAGAKKSATGADAATEAAPAKSKRGKVTPDRRQTALLMPVAGGLSKQDQEAEPETAPAPRRRKKDDEPASASVTALAPRRRKA